MATDLAGPGYHINCSNLLVLESKADMQKRGQASPDDGDALALTFAQAVAPAEKEERGEDDEFSGNGGINGPGSWDAMSQAPTIKSNTPGRRPGWVGGSLKLVSSDPLEPRPLPLWRSEC
jgi:hypothetical protein